MSVDTIELDLPTPVLPLVTRVTLKIDSDLLDPLLDLEATGYRLRVRPPRRHGTGPGVTEAAVILRGHGTERLLAKWIMGTPRGPVHLVAHLNGDWTDLRRSNLRAHVKGE